MKILTIVGPTAAGKTAIAVELARRIDGEIVSADSRQIYRHLEIGTAKPNARQRREVKFHLIDFVEPSEDYSCGQFARDAAHMIEGIRERHAVPIVCGGTGLYIKALFHPLDDLPGSSADTKAKLERMLKERGIEHMYAFLKRVDPVWASRVKPQDKQRILRGIEVFERTGIPLSRMLGQSKKPSGYSAVYIGITCARGDLYARIDERFDRMMEQGLVREVESLLAGGLDPSSNALRTIGYKEIVEYLQGKTSLEEATEKAKRRTRNYAKRQITWFNRVRSIIWHDTSDPAIVKNILDLWQGSRS